MLNPHRQLIPEMFVLDLLQSFFATYLNEMKEKLSKYQIEYLKSLVRIEDVISRTQALVPKGRYLIGEVHDSLVVDTQNQRFFWFSLDRSGDVITWLMETYSYSFPEAVAELATIANVGALDSLLQASEHFSAPQKKPERLHLPPSQEWQKRAAEVLREANFQLWHDPSKDALSYLHGRGFTSRTIRRIGFGWNSKNIFDPPELWGLEDGNKIWVPRGLIIPWLIDGQIWRLRVRRPEADLKDRSDPRYVNPRVYQEGGSVHNHDPIYLLSPIRRDQPVLLTEGEFDADSVWQEAHDVVNPVATGSVGGGRSQKWVEQLQTAPAVLLAFDADKAGSKAVEFWQAKLPQAVQLPPLAKDINEMLQTGQDIRAWVLSGLRLQAKS